MNTTYQLTGMTCSGCEKKIKSNLLSVSGINAVELSSVTNTATISMDKNISIETLQQAIGGSNSKYTISEKKSVVVPELAKRSWSTYQPLLLLFAFIVGIALLSSITNDKINIGIFANNFMGGFFIAFSFFKFLDLKGFAESYSMYDIVAIKIKSYGYIYPFIELFLGVCYITSFHPTLTNIATIIVMGISSIGVIRSVLQKQKIRCACLGSVFNLPMSTVTIVEDLLMIAMASCCLLFS